MSESAEDSFSGGYPFHIVDVFTDQKYAGNQLAVVGGAADLTADEMQAIAREMNYSETTFIESDDLDAGVSASGGSPEQRADGGYDVRIFTPESEIPFAGHPTLGTAQVLREVADDGADEVLLNLAIGQIPVTVQRAADGTEVLWMEQVDPEFGATLEDHIAAEVVSFEPEDLPGEYPAQVVSTGLPTLVVPLDSLEAVREAEIDRGAYDAHVVEELGITNVLVFAPGTVHDENDLHVRVFSPAHGVPEDPATGSSNGCLAAYLARHRFFGTPEIDVRVEQGYEIDRPSLLCLRAADEGESVRVEVGGCVVSVAEGRLV